MLYVVLISVWMCAAQVWPYRTATVRYARGITHAITGDVKAAREELAYFRAAAVEMPGTYTLHNNLCVDTLQVAEAMLVGELEYRAGVLSRLTTAVHWANHLIPISV